MGSHIDYYSGNGINSNPASNMMPMQLDEATGLLHMQQSQHHQAQQQVQRPLSVCSVSSCGPGGQGGPGIPSPVHHHHHHRSSSSSQLHGCGPASVAGSDDFMSDDQLMSLSVRELNKRLQGCPREEVSIIILLIFFSFELLR